jgi:hypothetical protein
MSSRAAGCDGVSSALHPRPGSHDRAARTSTMRPPAWTSSASKLRAGLSWTTVTSRHPGLRGSPRTFRISSIRSSMRVHGRVEAPGPDGLCPLLDVPAALGILGPMTSQRPGRCGKTPTVASRARAQPSRRSARLARSSPASAHASSPSPSAELMFYLEESWALMWQTYNEVNAVLAKSSTAR